MTASPERLSPRNVEAEAVVIGALMVDNRWADRIADKLSADDFFEPLHGRIFAAIVREVSLGRSANAVTIMPYFSDDPAFADVGGGAYLVRLSETTAALLAVETCAEQIRDMARRRRLIEGLDAASALAADMEATNEEVVNSADEAIMSASERDDAIVQISAENAFDEMLAQYDAPTHGVRSGRIECLDAVLGPIRPHHLVITAGRPGMGKTAVGLSYAIGAAQCGHGILFISLEMSRLELMQRATADICYDGRQGVPYDAIRDGTFSDAARRQVYSARRAFEGLPLHIVDAPALTIGRLNMIVRRYRRRMAAAGRHLDLVVVDYLQLLRPDHRTSGPYEAVSEVSRGLKMIAKTHDVGVMALAQLSRAVEQRADKRPMLSDLRDSGQIEQDADAVLFLYRDEYYQRMALPYEEGTDRATIEAAIERCAGEIDFMVAKRRNGPGGHAKGRFNGTFQAVRG